MTPSEGERERDTHTRTWRASSHSHSSSSPLHGGKRWARPEPCLVSTSLANLHRQRSYGGRGAVRAGVWTTPLPRKASILPCAAKAAHYTPCCPTSAFPSPRRMTQFSRGLRRSRTDIGAEDGTTTPEGATRTVTASAMAHWSILRPHLSSESLRTTSKKEEALISTAE